MYENPETSKQRVAERQEAGRRYVANRRRAGLTRENRRSRRVHFSLPRPNWLRARGSIGGTFSRRASGWWV